LFTRIFIFHGQHVTSVAYGPSLSYYHHVTNVISMAALGVSIYDVRQNFEVIPQAVSLQFVCHQIQTHFCVQPQASRGCSEGFCVRVCRFLLQVSAYFVNCS